MAAARLHGMDVTKRLPSIGVRKRLPVVGSDDDETPPEGDASPPLETHAEGVDVTAEADLDETGPGDDLESDDEDESSGRSRLRKLLLGVSAFGIVLAVAAALIRRALGGDEDQPDEEIDVNVDITIRDETREGPSMEEGTAAALGLAFLLVAEAIRDRLETPTN